jgi:hypothetical protein
MRANYPTKRRFRRTVCAMTHLSLVAWHLAIQPYKLFGVSLGSTRVTPTDGFVQELCSDPISEPGALATG